MTCEGWRQYISSWLDGEIEESDEAALYSHLAVCVACRRFSREVREVSRMLVRGAAHALPGTTSGANEPLTETGTSVLGSRLLLTAIMASIIAAVIFLSSPRISEVDVEKAASGSMSGYPLWEQISTGLYR